MKILSIDVGIKNLAYCLFNKSEINDELNIIKWDIVDISEEEEIIICSSDECNKPAKFKKKETCFCLKHSKKQSFKIPTSQQKASYINKQKIKTLYEMAEKMDIKYDPKIKKLDLSNLIKNYINANYFDVIESKKAAEVNLYNIGLNIKTKFNKLFENEEKIEYVIIENQISTIATRMKTIQGMIVQYFIMANIKVDNIEFISASNKLKDCDAKDKATYADRKKLGIIKCLELITTNIGLNGYIHYFNQHKKKDDLSDSFLQGIWFINNKIK
jgi:hypothetical protein